MAENAKTDGGGIDREECRPAQMRLGQEHVKHGGGGGDIKGGDEELARGGAAVGKAQSPFAEPDRLAVAADIGGGNENGNDGERSAP